MDIKSLDEHYIICSYDGIYRVVDDYESTWIIDFNWHLIDEHDLIIKSRWLETYYYQFRKNAKGELGIWVAEMMDQVLYKALTNA